MSSDRPPAPRRRRRRVPWGAYLALVPTLGLLAFFAYYPDINGLVHSLTNWEPGFSSPFVGLANYRAMWHDSLWWEAFVHIGIIFVVAVTAMWVIPLAAAELLITISRPRWRLFFRYLLIVPLAFSPVIQVLTWQLIYDPNVGVLNDFLGKVGLTALEKNWLGDPNTALWALIFINFPWGCRPAVPHIQCRPPEHPPASFSTPRRSGGRDAGPGSSSSTCRCRCVRSSCCSSLPSSSCCSTGSPPTSPPKAVQTTRRQYRSSGSWGWRSTPASGAT